MLAVSRCFRTLGKVLTAAALASASIAAVAQSFPSRDFRWVVSYPPGGGSDFLARTVGAQLSAQTKQPVVIDNRPGAAGFVAAELVARAPGDGYTLFTGDNGTLVYNAALFKKTPYNASTDFAPVGMMARFPLVLVARADTPYTSAKVFLEAIRRQPGALNYGSPGLGTPHHLAMELLKQSADLSIVPVQYRGSGPAVTDLLGGQVPVVILDTAAALPMIRSGKVKALAAFSQARSAALPDTPTFVELGFDGVEAYGWQALVVPASTPKDVIHRLSAELTRAIRTPEVAAKLTDFGLELTPGDPAAAGRYIEGEVQLWHQLIKRRNIKLE